MRSMFNPKPFTYIFFIRYHLTGACIHSLLLSIFKINWQYFCVEMIPIIYLLLKFRIAAKPDKIDGYQKIR